MKEFIIHPVNEETEKEFINHGAPELVRCKDCKYRPKQPEPGKKGFALEFPVEYACPCECDDGYYS